MDTRKLEALAVSVKLGSFTRAAEALGYTQSGLTHMMNSLERDIGFPVLVRCRSGVKLTPEGKRLFPMIQELLEASALLEKEIEQVSNRREETIRVAAYASVAMHWLPEVIQRFRRAHPQVQVDIQMGSVEEVYRWVREGKADMCFASRQEHMNDDLEWTHLMDDPMLAILPPDYPLESRTSFSVRHFRGQEFLMPSMGFHLDIMRALESCKELPNIRTTQVSDSVIISMVEHGLGVSILSELVLRGRKGDVQALPLQPAAVRDLGIAAPPGRELRTLHRRFIEEAREIIPTL